jgi:hypothetical protein
MLSDITSCRGFLSINSSLPTTGLNFTIPPVGRAYQEWCSGREQVTRSEKRSLRLGSSGRRCFFYFVHLLLPLLRTILSTRPCRVGGFLLCSCSRDTRQPLPLEPIFTLKTPQLLARKTHVRHPSASTTICTVRFCAPIYGWPFDAKRPTPRIPTDSRSTKTEHG